MEQSLFAVVALVLVSLCEGKDSDFCFKKTCPEYNVTQTQQDFETRRYGPTRWIVTKMDSSKNSDVLAAYSTLKDFCSARKENGHEIPDNSWPALITATEGQSAQELTMSWFVPGTSQLESSDVVEVQNRPEVTVYVRVFGGIPSVQAGEDNARMLREALTESGKSFDRHTYIGASYDPYIALSHHNEIWIFAA